MLVGTLSRHARNVLLVLNLMRNNRHAMKHHFSWLLLLIQKRSRQMALLHQEMRHADVTNVDHLMRDFLARVKFDKDHCPSKDVGTNLCLRKKLWAVCLNAQQACRLCSCLPVKKAKALSNQIDQTPTCCTLFWIHCWR